MFIVPPPEYHFQFGTGLVLLQSAICQLQNKVMVTLESNITMIGDQEGSFSSKTSSRPRFKVDKDTAKGEFINLLKELGDYRLLDSFLASRCKELQNKGLFDTSTTNNAAKLSQMAEKKPYNMHDWTAWSACFLETSQYLEMAPSLWIFGYERLHSANSTSPPLWVHSWTEIGMTVNNMTKEELN